MTKHPTIIGRSEQLDIIDVALNVPAKVDSGAFRSSIHATSVKEKKQADGTVVLAVGLLGHPCSPVVRDTTFADYNKVTITNSFGQEEERFEVMLKVRIAHKVFTTSFTLADRSNNLFPVLVGRKLLRDRFLVDVSRSDVNRIKLKKEFGIATPVDEEDLEK